jgi:hypothetical protein
VVQEKMMTMMPQQKWGEIFLVIFRNSISGWVIEMCTTVIAHTVGLIYASKATEKSTGRVAAAHPHHHENWIHRGWLGENEQSMQTINYCRDFWTLSNYAHIGSDFQSPIAKSGSKMQNICAQIVLCRNTKSFFDFFSELPSSSSSSSSKNYFTGAVTVGNFEINLSHY